jgi:hypothetical protein
MLRNFDEAIQTKANKTSVLHQFEALKNDMLSKEKLDKFIEEQRVKDIE